MAAAQMEIHSMLLGLDGLVKHLAKEVKVKQAKGQGFAAEG